MKTEKDVLDKMNEWYVCVCAQGGRQADETQVHQPAWEGAFASSRSLTPLAQMGMVVFPIGLLIWAWTAQAQTFWLGPVIGSAIFAYGLMLAFNSIQVRPPSSVPINAN